MPVLPEILPEILHGGEIDRPVAIVAAHPDDEVLALGGRLDAFLALRIIHLTDGAPRNLADAHRAGCSDTASYAARRRAELRAALTAAGGGAAELRAYDYPDKEAIWHAAEIVAHLERDLADVAAVFTHPYEGGHPDHDTAAFAASLACIRLAERGRSAPSRFEFPSYHLKDGGGVFGIFWPDRTAPETVLPLTDTRCARKRAALACFESQAAVIERFPTECERIRPAPVYDFSATPPPGGALYDRWGWAITSRDWRRAAAALL